MSIRITPTEQQLTTLDLFTTLDSFVSAFDSETEAGNIGLETEYTAAIELLNKHRTEASHIKELVRAENEYQAQNTYVLTTTERTKWYREYVGNENGSLDMVTEVENATKFKESEATPNVIANMSQRTGMKDLKFISLDNI